MARSTIKMWVQSCPYCGYCAPDISESIDKASEIIHSSDYKAQLKNQKFPELANKFLCYGMIEENAGNYAKAGKAYVHAAWVCDDNSAISDTRYRIRYGCDENSHLEDKNVIPEKSSPDPNARECRMKAVAMFKKAKEYTQSFAAEPLGEFILMIDLLRRSGEFEQAMKLCDEVFREKTEKIISDIVRFEKTLINKSDIACHTVAEATKDDK
ncbi:MAG TPA: hypothetical protein PLW02_00390 [Verrucomicrobiota bacterium]|nr:hypothetical protein [Verrucomicrobiota bacterium]